MKRLHIGVLFLILSVGCVDEIDFPVREASELMNIAGQFTDSLEEQEIIVLKAAPVRQGGPIFGQPVVGATVYVESESGEIFPFTEEIDGFYRTIAKGEPGQSYRAVVKTPDGLMYQSTYQQIPTIESDFDVTPQKYATRELTSDNAITDGLKVGLFLSANLESQGEKTNNLYRVVGEYDFWEWEGAMDLNPRHCYPKEYPDYGQVTLFSGIDEPGAKIDHELFFSTKPDHRFSFNYCFHVIQHTINRESFLYWDKVAKLANQDIGLFDPPLGKVRGNMRNAEDPLEEVLGNFTVSAVKEKRFFANSLTLEIEVFPLCLDPTRTELHDYCRNCLKIANSTLVKPDYFP
ncbi:MAG: DUF4249 domain-containing protein [Saprospiraceae bacterium]